MAKKHKRVYIDHIADDGTDAKKAREVLIRKAMRSGRLDPTPAGTLVTGNQGPFSAPRTACEGHLWVTGPPIEDDAWQSGYKQGARCIICRWKVVPIDASWWIDLPSKIRVEQTVELIDDLLESMQRARRKLIRYKDVAQAKHEVVKHEIERAITRRSKR